MRINKIYIIKSKFYDVVIIDQLHSNLFDILIKNRKKLIIPVRESIPIILNFNFFYKLFFYLVKNKFSYSKIRTNYLSFLFKFIKTKKVFTFYENTNRIRNLKKKFPNIKFYTFINGTRVPNYKYKHDNFVSWGKIYYQMDKSNLSIKSNNYLNLGSLRLLNYKNQIKKKIKENYDLLYISSFSSVTLTSNRNIFSIYKYIKMNEIRLMRNLSYLNNSKNINLKVLMKNKKSDRDFFEEYSYLLKYFSKRNIVIKNRELDSYHYIENSKITISLVSALGLEALSLNTKVLLGFPIFKKNKMKHWSSLDYYCKYLKPQFSLSSLSADHLLKKIKFLETIKKKDYNKLTENCRNFYSVKPVLKKFLKRIYEN
tara:strand:+ start:1723 stop:2832 length:1110 start_codon:yes stop_codon:yes gene_type:complete